MCDKLCLSSAAHQQQQRKQTQTETETDTQILGDLRSAF